MEIGVLPEQEKIEREDDDSFLERIWNKVDTGIKAIDFTPISLASLKVCFTESTGV